jgi:octopine/nopaline transport system substrate-binding protein
MMKLTTILGLAAALLSGPAVAQERTVRIATEGAYAPYNFTRPDGKLDGFEVDLAADLCRRMKVKCEVVAQDWDGIVPALQAKKYDAIMAGMNITDKRREVLDFSRSYSGDSHGLMSEKDGPLAKLPGGQVFNLKDDPATAQKGIDAIKPLLKGKTIGVQTSTIHANFLNQYLKDTVEIREYKTTEQHDLDLAAGRVDAVFASDTALRGTLEKPDFAKGFALVGPRFKGGVFGSGVAVGLRKGEPELKAMFDDAITAAIIDGTLKKLSEKWFKVDITPAQS